MLEAPIPTPCLDCPVNQINLVGGCTALRWNFSTKEVSATMPSRLESQCGIINDPNHTFITNEELLSAYNALVEASSRGGILPDYQLNLMADALRKIRSDFQEREESKYDPAWNNLVEEWVNPEDEEDRDKLQRKAEKYNLTIHQLAKIEAGVWKGTYMPAKYADPRALDLVREVAQAIGLDDTIKSVIEDFCGVKFDEGITLEQALSDLPDLKERQDRRAADMIGGVLREILPDSVIVDRRKADEAIQQEFRQDNDKV